MPTETQYKKILMPSGDVASLVGEDRTYRNPIINDKNLVSNVQGAMGFWQTNPFAGPQSANMPGQSILSDIDTFNKNLRYYFVSQFRQTLSQAYVEYGLVRTIIDVPVEDGYRGGVTFKTDELDEEDLIKLLKHMKRRGDFQCSMRGQKWGSLFGGGGIICFVSDQDPEEPLDLSKIGPNSKIEFRAVDLWELSPNNMNVNEGDPAQQNLNYDWFQYYGEKVHKTRVKMTFGEEVPSFVRARLRGWKASKVERLIRSINQYLKRTDLVFEVLDEFKLDVFMIEGWKQSLATPEGEALALKRIQYANGRKNYLHATILDVLDKFEQRMLNFSGLAEVGEDGRLQIASDMRMPLTKIFGISAQGFNAGQEDLENYNMMVEATVREAASDIVIWMAEIRCAELFQVIPEDLEDEWKPLRVMTSLDEQTVKTGKATIIDNARNRGDITLEEYRDAVNAGKLMDVKLENSPAILTELETVQEEKTAAATDEKGGEAGKSGGKAAEVPSAKDAPKKGKAVGNLFQRIMNAVGVQPGGKYMFEFKKLKNDKDPEHVETYENLKDEYEHDHGTFEMTNEEAWAAHVENGPIWKKAKEAVQKEYGEIRWPVVQYLYKKLGG